MAVFAEHRAVDALGAGVDHALDVEGARRLQYVNHAHHVDLDAERRVGGGDRADEGGGVHDMAHPMRLDGLQEARHVEHVTQLDIDLVGDIPDQASSRWRAKMTGRWPSLTNLRLVSAPMTPIPPVIRTFTLCPPSLSIVAQSSPNALPSARRANRQRALAFILADIVALH